MLISLCDQNLHYQMKKVSVMHLFSISIANQVITNYVFEFLFNR